MKTIEERAREICESVYINDPFAVEVESVAALLRADREEVLRRVEDVLCSGNYEAIGAYQKLVQEVIRYLIDAVKKEALE